MLIGSKIPPQADIIKFVITGGDPRVAGCGAVCQAKILASLGISLTPLNYALNAFTLALKYSSKKDTNSLVSCVPSNAIE